jgi:glycosyltransferase involved in cell wall biosynthesis
MPLKEMGIDAMQVSNKPYIELLKNHPVVFFNRLPTEPVDSFLLNKKKIGFKYIVDLDDYFHLFPGHYLQYHWINNKIAESLIKIIQNADVVTTTNNVLAGKIAEYNKNIVIIPNALPFDTDQFTLKNAGELHGMTRFIYAAGASHAHDAMMLHEPLHLLNRVNKFDNHSLYEIKLAGVESINPQHHAQWEYMQSIVSLESNMTGNGYYRQEAAKPVMEYMSLYDNSDVALAPLQDNDFNRCKSNLKVLEAGAKGIPIITSAIHPYKNGTDSPNVEHAATPREWFKLMKWMIENPEYRRDTGAMLAEHVRKYYHLKKVNEIRRQLFEHVAGEPFTNKIIMGW